tara:strand:+ start:4210 stop:4686 length:477 start_codon:yes stop_codon:yes gene_type:complete
MASNNNLTTNTNFLSPTGFKLVINREKFANTEYFCTSASLPNVSLGVAETNYQQFKGYVPGDVTHEELTVRIAVDEDLVVYKEILDWIYRNRDAKAIEVHDATLLIMSSSFDASESKQIRLTNMFPTSIASLEFNTQNTDVEYFQADVSFRYDYYKFL